MRLNIIPKRERAKYKTAPFRFLRIIQYNDKIYIILRITMMIVSTIVISEKKILKVFSRIISIIAFTMY